MRTFSVMVKIFLVTLLLIFFPLFINGFLGPLDLAQETKDAYTGNIFMLICCALLGVLWKKQRRKMSRWTFAYLILLIIFLLGELCVLLSTWEYLF